jgi:acetyl esterase/lipase
MSAEGNASRVEHILEKRRLRGKPTEELYQGLFGPGLERTKAAYAVSIRKDVIAGVKVLIYEPAAGVAKRNARRLLINVHGGGFVACFVQCGGMESIPLAALTGMRVISIDYRESPDHYPAATEDVLAVYRQLLKTTPARRIGLFGCSAGGILTAQTLAALPRHGLPEPAAAGIFCAGGDPGMGGDSAILGNLLGDGEGPRAGAGEGNGATLGYMAGASRDDPEAYPAGHPAVLKSFPPTLVVTGTRDFASSSAIYLHSKLVEAGVDARLHVWEGGRHAFFYDVRVPEAREAHKVMAAFFDTRVAR